MTETKCPVCGCSTFYIKNLQDAYDLCEFQYRDGRICFDPSVDASAVPRIDSDKEIFCNDCSWHGGFGVLKQEKP
ncbi:MAG: hypothetical protein U9Q38_06980 [Thermodesulfobacteriota bacterium]|nr:hypothetical protein [Thermodesulfobacteriota bacterium]